MATMFGLAHLGADPRMGAAPSGDAVMNLALAFSWGKKDPQTGKRQTQWVDAVMWGERAAAIEPYLSKGSKVMVTLDEVHIETFPKNGGGEGFKLAGRISNLEFAGDPPQQAAQGSQQRQAAAPAPAPRNSNAPRQQPAPAPRPAPRPAPNFSDMDDDIPFIADVTLMTAHCLSKQLTRSKHGRGTSIEF